MSAAENLVPEPPTWDLTVSEVERAGREDPGFREAQCRARAKGRGETYNQAKHGPFEAKLPPRQEREKMEKATVDVEALLARFRAKARPDEPGVRRIHDR